MTDTPTANDVLYRDETEAAGQMERIRRSRWRGDAQTVISALESWPSLASNILYPVAAPARRVHSLFRTLRTASAEDNAVIDETLWKELATIPGWDWDFSAAVWAEAEPSLNRLVAVNGDVVPRLDLAGSRDSIYVMDLHHFAPMWHEAGILSDTVMSKLRTYPGWTDEHRQFRWHALTTSYRKAFGDGFNLLRLRPVLEGRLYDELNLRVNGRANLSDAEIRELESLPCFVWDVKGIGVLFASRALASLDIRRAELTAWTAAPKASRGEKPRILGIDKTAQSLPTAFGGRDGLDLAAATYLWRAGKSDLPVVEPSALDTLSEIALRVTDVGHSDFEPESPLSAIVLAWRQTPAGLHPMIREALDVLPGWQWSAELARMVRLLPEFEYELTASMADNYPDIVTGPRPTAMSVTQFEEAIAHLPRFFSTGANRHWNSEICSATGEIKGLYWNMQHSGGDSGATITLKIY